MPRGKVARYGQCLTPALRPSLSGTSSTVSGTLPPHSATTAGTLYLRASVHVAPTLSKRSERSG